MKTTTVANLCNNFRAISAWIDHSETMQITKRGHAYAVPTATSRARVGKQGEKPALAFPDSVVGQIS
jgi:hypothetical protein